MKYTSEQKKYKFVFGKYVGLTIGELLDKNPGYLQWCEKNVANFIGKSKMLNRGESPIPTYSKSKKETYREDENGDVITDEVEEEKKEIKMPDHVWQRSLTPNTDFYNQKD